MEKTCLVTGRSGETLSSIAQEALSRGRNTLLARSGTAESVTVPEGAHVSSWNRRSALSARTLVLHAQNLFERLDEAVIFFSPIRDSAPFHESSIVGIENRTDAEVKGFLFLIRELLSAFQKQSSGRLVLAVRDLERETRSPLEAMSIGGFVAAAEAIYRYYDGDRIDIRLAALRPEDDGGNAAFASFLFDSVDAEPGRRNRGWNSFPPRTGLFSRGARATFIDQRSAID